MNVLLLKFAVSLLLTLLLELPVVLLFGARKKDLLLFLLLNIMTNPVAVFLSLCVSGSRGLQIAIEAAVILIEGLYYRKDAVFIKHWLACSICANGFSYGMGLVLSALT